jgi:hypothetical protein
MLTYYEITIQGHLDQHWSTWFDGLSITHESNGTTTLAGPIVDQAALHGVQGARPGVATDRRAPGRNQGVGRRLHCERRPATALLKLYQHLI